MAEFDRIVRPYLMSGQVGKRWEVVFRFKLIDRVKWLLKKSVRQDKLAKVEQ